MTDRRGGESGRIYHRTAVSLPVWRDGSEHNLERSGR